jgi:hypothetical protein
MLPLSMLSSYSVQSLSPSPRPSSPRALRVPAFRSLPPSFNLKLSTFNCLAPQSPHQYHSMEVTLPLFSYSYALFCTAKNPNPFRFMSFHTLSTKHPGWATPRFSATSAMKIAPCRRPLKSELVFYCQLSAVSCQPPFLISPGATTTPATPPLSPLVTILGAFDAASSLSPAFATLTKNTRGGVSPSLSTSPSLLRLSHGTNLPLARLHRSER